MQKLSKEQMIGIAVGVVILILIIVALAKNNSSITNTNTTTDTNGEQASSTPTTTPNTAMNKPAVKPAAPKVSYTDKIKQYEGRRFQINDSCQVFPAQATFVNNTAVMFDNESALDRVISLSGKDFTVKAKNWIEIKLTSKTLPNTINVSCGGAYNVARITLQ